MNKIEINDLKNKYIKYKSKYHILKNKKQNGGNPLTESNIQNVSSSYLTKDELSDVIKGKLCIRSNISDSSLQSKHYYNLDNTIKVYEIKNCIVQGVTTGTYNIISKNNDGYIEINFITIYESPNIESRYNKQHINSFHKTKQHIIGPFTLYQNSIKGQILSYKSSDSNTYVYTVYPQ